MKHFVPQSIKAQLQNLRVELAAGSGVVETDAALAWLDTDPAQPPGAVYPEVSGVVCGDFQLPPEGLSALKRTLALAQLHAYQSLQKSRTLGFQANQDIHYQEDLKPFLNFHINNVGDPFQTGSFTLNSKWMERAGWRSVLVFLVEPS